MFPIHEHRCFSNHESQVELRIHLSETIMRTSSEDQEVLSSFDLCVTRVISLRIIIVGIFVDLRVAESRIDRWNDHGACEH